MKPNFALTLTFEGIGLLHRTHAGWHLVGEVGLDAEDLAGDLATLAAKARSLDPTGLRSKIVLPDEQIKYLSFESTEQDIGLIDAQVREALDGATPYALKELTYDWSVRGGKIYVAAVARETLSEAESFAVEHSFNPLCFVAMPDETAFAGEPFFGETVHAGKILGPDEAIDRENTVIRIVGAAHLPEPDPVPESDSEPVPEPAPGPEARPEPKQAPEPEGPAPEAPASPSGQPVATGRKKKRGEKREKPRAEPAAPVAFASTRAAADDGGKAPGSDGAMPAPDLPKARFTPPPAALSDPEPRPESAPDPETGTVDLAGIGDAALPRDAHARRDASLPETPEEAPADAGREAAMPDPVAGESFVSRRKPKTGLSFPKFGGKSSRKAETQTAALAGTELRPATQELLDEKQRMTIFGARRDENARPDKPRYLALILTAVLLLILVAIAAWAALFLDDGISGVFRRAETQVASTPVSAPEQSTDPADSEEETVGDVTAALPQDGAGVAQQGTDAPQTPPAITIPEELTPDEARARYAATGIWQVAPEPSTAPGTTQMEDVYQNNLDPPVNISDAVALPGVDALLPSPRPATPSNPPPLGTQFDLDGRGFIAATPEGTETPEGVTIFAGAPPIKPPPTPPRAAPEKQGPAAAAPEDPTPRPRVRPEDLTDKFERNQLGGRTRTELATLSPHLRPKSDQQIAEEALAAETGTDPTAEDGDPLAGATAQAVAVSPKPQTRPESFAAIVRQSREATASEPVSQDQRVAASIPTAASVARAATEKNRISLRKVNLIGVYGNPDSRRALVRLANGSYRKVQVGDRLDGGQVAAIGEDELHYVKSGKSVVLKMPKG